MKLKEYPFDRFGCREIRVIDDTDCACEGDDAFAVAHLLLTSKFDVRGIAATGFMHMEGSAEKSFDAVTKLLDVMGLTGQVPVLHGGPAMISEKEYERSEASDFIVEEALKEDQRPLFVVAHGAITNLAVALKSKPEIAKKIQCIWIGGAPYPDGGWEFNLSGDVIAARTVMESGMPLWQVPQNVYSMMRVSFTTIYERLYFSGAPGKYLCEQLWEAHKRMSEFSQMGRETVDSNATLAGEEYTGFACGDMWILGDSPVVGLMLNSQIYDRDIVGAPYINDDGTYTLRPDNPRKIAVYNSIDSQFILNDFFDKMKFQYGDHN